MYADYCYAISDHQELSVVRSVEYDFGWWLGQMAKIVMSYSV